MILVSAIALLLDPIKILAGLFIAKGFKSLHYRLIAIFISSLLVTLMVRINFLELGQTPDDVGLFTLACGVIGFWFLVFHFIFNWKEKEPEDQKLVNSDITITTKGE